MQNHTLKATLTIEHGWLKSGQHGTLRPNKEKAEVRTSDCNGLFTPAYFFAPAGCGYEFGVRASEVTILTTQNT